jgi:hypothetical protein
MLEPNPVRLFHITAIANLLAICQSGALLSKNAGALVGINYQNIAHQGAQGARAGRAVPNPPGGKVHDFVPFYFAPRSPMLRAIEGGRVVGCEWRQADIVHFETNVDELISENKDFVFYDLNATLAWSTAYTDLTNLNKVAWDLICENPTLDGYCKYWQSVAGHDRYSDRMERRQAEFLVKDAVKLTRFTRIGVINDERANEVRAILAKAGVNLLVEVKSDWYF